MPLQKGDFVLVEYEVRTKDTNRLVDTTDEELAKKEGIYEQDRVYGPVLVVVGEGKLIPGLEEAIAEMDVGEEKTVEIPPEKAYGKHDPSKVKTVSLGVFRRRGIMPKPGDLIEVDGQVARVVAVSGGRVILDFNHPLAGKTLVARIRIVAKLEKDEDKVKHLAARRLRVKPEEVKVEVDRDKGVVRLRLSTRAALRATPSAKLLLVDEIRRYIDWVRKVEVVEEYEVKRGEGEGQQEQASGSSSEQQ